MTTRVTALQYNITDLGILPGFESSRATGLNDRGQVIGSLSHEFMDCDPNSFLWSEGTMCDFGKVWLKDINNKGQIVGAKHPQHVNFSAVISNGGRFEKLMKNTASVSMAQSINERGQVVGYHQSIKLKSPISVKRGCFLWENGKRRYLDIPEGYRAGEAVAIDNDGQIAGELWKGIPSQSHACLWDADAVKVFEEPSEFNQSKSISINSVGQVLVRAFYSNYQELLAEASQSIEVTWTDGANAVQEAFDAVMEKASAIPDDAWQHRQQHFLWQNDELLTINGLAEAVNDQGQVVGWSGCALNAIDLAKGHQVPYAFLWQNDEMLDLNDLLLPDSGWRLTKASDINNKGQIVGYGEIDGKTRAFLLTPTNNL